MPAITRRDVAEPLQERIDWQAQVTSYFTRGGRKMPEAVRQGVLENRAKVYRMAQTLGIDLERYNAERL